MFSVKDPDRISFGSRGRQRENHIVIEQRCRVFLFLPEDLTGRPAAGWYFDYLTTGKSLLFFKQRESNLQLLHLKYSDAFRRLRLASSASTWDPWWPRCPDVWVTVAKRCPYLLKNLGPASMSVDRTASSGAPRIFCQDLPGLVVVEWKWFFVLLDGT